MRKPEPIEIEPDAWCAWCGDPLPEPEERHHHLRYCSAVCRRRMAYDLIRERRMAARKPQPCRWCGTLFMPRTEKVHTCSRKCKEAMQNWRRYWRKGWRPGRDPWVVTHGGEDPDAVAARR